MLKQEAIGATYLTRVLGAWSNKGRNKVEQPCKVAFETFTQTLTNILTLRNILCSIWITPWIISISHTMDYFGGLPFNWSLNERYNRKKGKILF